MAKNVINASDVVINNFRLTHKNDVIEILPLTMAIDIFDTLKRPCIRAFVDIADGTGILSSITLAGCIVDLEFYSIDENQPTVLKFIVDKISNVKVNSRIKTYTMELITPEYFTAISTQVTENFTDMAPQKMIALILKQYMKVNPGKFQFEPGSNDTVPITNMNPLQAIDKIRRRAVSLGSESSSYVFFENKDGFNFNTIERLYSEGKVGDRKFTTKTLSPNPTRDVVWRDVLSYEQIRAQNLAETIALGGIKTTTFGFNMETGEYTVSSYERRSDEIHTSTVHITSEDNKFSPEDKTETKTAFVLLRNENELPRAEKLSKISAFISKMLSNMINIHVHGDNLLTSGEVCQLDVTRVDGLTTLRSDEMLTGKYLIGSVRHNINKVNEKFVYTCACELIKPGFAER